MTQQAPTNKLHALRAVDSIFTIKFGLFLALLTTFILPLLLLSPLVAAKILGLNLASYAWITMDNFGVFILIAQSIGLLICLTIIARKLKKSNSGRSTVGLTKFKPLQGIRYVAGYYLILLGLLITLAIVAASIGIEPPTPPEGETGGSGLLKAMGSFWLTFALSVVLAPIIEEIVFRGVLFPAIAKRYGLAAGIIGSSLIFTLVHVNPIQMLSVLPLGIYLAIMYRRTGSIYPGMILHATWNLLVLLIAQASV